MAIDRKNVRGARREWRFSLRHVLFATAAIGLLMVAARRFDPILVASTLIGGGLGALVDAILRRRWTSVGLALLLFLIAAAFLMAR